MKMLISSLFLSLIFSFSTCSEKQNLEPCFTDRKVESKIENLSVICLRGGDQTILNEVNGSKRFSVCNPSEYEIMADQTYLISGFIYEIKANERWAGTPLQLTEVKKQE